MTKFPERLKEVRRESGKKQREVAEMLGMKLRGYQSYEMGEAEPGLEKLMMLADLFHVSIDYLVGRTDQK